MLISLSVSLGLENLATTVKAGGADVVTQMDFAGGAFNSSSGGVQRVVRTVHTTLGGRFFVLLNGHDGLRKTRRFSLSNCQTTSKTGGLERFLKHPKRAARLQSAKC